MSARLVFARPARILSAALAPLALAILLAAPPARAGDIVVAYDQSQLLRMPRPVASVIVGNPSIADVSIQSGNLIVVTGKSFGVTNLILLDDQQKIIQDQRLVVKQDETRMVNLSKGGKTESYSCTPNCSPTMTIGNDPNYFDTVSRHSSTKQQFSEGTTPTGGTIGETTGH